MSIYILNTSILPNAGDYSLHPISVEKARELLSNNSWVSAVGHKATAEILSMLMGISIPVNRIPISMEVGDSALVFKLKQRLPEGVIISTPEELEEIGYDLLLLRRLPDIREVLNRALSTISSVSSSFVPDDVTEAEIEELEAVISFY